MWWGVRIYNTMVEKDEGVKKQWSHVETAYQRRYDLIDNLVNTVKGYADFEKSTLTEVIEARAKASSIEINADDLSEENIAKYQEAQSELSGTLSRLMVVVEQYPDLKANEQFTALQDELKNTENMIQAARMAYNEVVKDFNAYVRKFPKNIFAKMFGFKPYGYFQADEEAAKRVEVKF
ncbi:MAG: LemA family protein [Bacteroidales bacterium]|nr:LemA family protein [Bacteroidales bacterium]